jgi:DNA-binding NtrC family response regulator
MGGTLMVYSEIGHGTSFTIYFPVADDEVSDDAVAEIAIPRGTERVLIVDDEPAIARLAARILERLGYTTTFFTVSTEALEEFKSFPDKYDVLLSDQSMPKLNGRDLAAEIQKINPNIAVVIMTGFSDSAHAAKNLSELFTQISKPLLSYDLAVKIRQALKS